MAWEPQRLNYSHEALVAQILANPTASNAELGAVFGRSKEWVSMVKNSGLFREMIAAKRAEIVDPVLTATMEERLEMATNRSLEILNEKLSRPSQDIPDEFALQAAIFGAKASGLGGFAARPVPAPPAPDLGRIERLADRLINLGRPAPLHPVQEISDAQFVEQVRAESSAG